MLLKRPAHRAVVWTMALLPAVIAVAQLGRVHPDELFQALEPAYHRAFGYGVLAWEWRVGLRNWAVPLVFAALLKLAAALGIEHPVGYRAVLELPQLALHAASLFAVYRYAARRVDPTRALLCTALVGLYAPVLTFAGRTMGESISTSFLLLAVDALDAPYLRRRALAGGAFLGFAVVARYGSAVCVLAALGWLLLAGKYRALVWTSVGGLAVALGLGALDWATWGKPFHSFIQYVDFNVLSGKAAQQFGQDPARFYLSTLLDAPLWAWLGIPFIVERRRPWAPLPLTMALLYAVAIVLTPHKEHRFAYPALVLFAVACAPGLIALVDKLGRATLRRWALGVALAASLAPFFFRTKLSVQRADQFRAVVKATRADATGLLIVNEGLWGTPGFFYIGRNIPWLVCDWPHDGAFRQAMVDRRINRAVTYDGRALEELKANGFEVTERIGRATILRR